MEHELYEVHSSLQQTIEKLYAQERESEARIAELEGQLSKQVRMIFANAHKQQIYSKLQSLQQAGC